MVGHIGAAEAGAEAEAEAEVGAGLVVLKW